jgi:hypothetical protein
MRLHHYNIRAPLLIIALIVFGIMCCPGIACLALRALFF